jgi:hypothetical protein
MDLSARALISTKVRAMKKITLSVVALFAALHTNAQDLCKAKPAEPAESQKTTKKIFIQQQR